ncbi:MAG: hypothetical protein SGJ05_10525 [bacterium]|nr:hypothetical protein [bacterium]
MARILTALILLLLLFLTSCQPSAGPERMKMMVYTPVYMSLDAMRSGVEVKTPQSLQEPGKIYVFGRYLFVAERMKGVHIIDNQNPASPQPLSFLAIPGAGDIAVRGNVLYADSYIDLLTFDISSPTDPRLVDRIENIFPQPLQGDGWTQVDPDSGVVVEWKQEEIEVEAVDNHFLIDVMTADGPVRREAATSNPSASGKGGSMARFTIVDRYLYAVTQTDIQLFDIANALTPRVWSRVNVGWGIETIFPYKDMLFIGSNVGMFIFDNSNPSNPTQLCEFSHARACDPVVAENTTAYVTLRSGNTCAGTQNQLDIIDITNITAPVLLKTYFMQEPHGVGIDGSTLFVCDGRAGLKVYNATDPMNIVLLGHFPMPDCYDIIPLGKTAIVVAKDGIHQLDYTNPAAITELSVLKVSL